MQSNSFIPSHYDGWRKKMLSLPEISLILFGLVNSLRIVAYLPQIVAISKDTHGAKAVSRMTWTLFAACHIVTVAYALINLKDWRVAVVFGANAFFCIVIVVMASLKRRAYRTKGAHPGAGNLAVVAVPAAPRLVSSTAGQRRRSDSSSA